MFLECKSYGESQHSHQLRSGKEEEGKQDALHGNQAHNKHPLNVLAYI